MRLLINIVSKHQIVILFDQLVLPKTGQGQHLALDIQIADLIRDRDLHVVLFR